MIDKLLPKNDIHRKILHLDMDAFYASVELRDHPDLVNKAVVIAHDPRLHNGHGVITTANYIARKYGVGSAMPAIKAVQRIPADKLVFINPNFNKYRAVSAQIHEVMNRVSDQVESVSLDEAYLDITHNKLGDYSSIQLGNYMQKEIFRITGLTSSFGVSYNKFLAKMGSEYAKPFGRTIILPQDAQRFLAKQPINKFPGIGKKTQPVLQELGIHTGADLQAKSVKYLIDHFKKFGYYMALHAHGIDLRPVVGSRQRKSIGKERTFEPLLTDKNKALSFLRQCAQDVANKLQEKGLIATVVTLKIRNQKFETQTKQMQLKATRDAMDIFDGAKELFDSMPQYLDAGIRLLGLSVSGIRKSKYEEIELPLFSTEW